MTRRETMSPMTRLEVTSERGAGSVLVRLRGDFDLYSCAEVRSEVEGLYGEAETEVVLDLSGVTFLDSSGLGTLIGLQKRANQGSGQLKLTGLTSQVQKIFDITHLTGAFTIVPAHQATAE
jgi:anti-sigma B factor antagonist